MCQGLVLWCGVTPGNPPRGALSAAAAAQTGLVVRPEPSRREDARQEEREVQDKVQVHRVPRVRGERGGVSDLTSTQWAAVTSHWRREDS